MLNQQRQIAPTGVIPTLRGGDSWISDLRCDSFLADGLIREAGDERSDFCSRRFRGGRVAGVGGGGSLGKPRGAGVVIFEKGRVATTPQLKTSGLPPTVAPAHDR